MSVEDQFLPEITREQLAALLERHNLGPLEQIETLRGGIVNPMLRVNRRMVVRINRRDPDLPKLAWEALVYRRLRAANVPCPEVLALDTNRDLVPYDVLVLNYVEGVAGTAVWTELDLPAREALSEELGRICGTVHTLRWPVYGEFLSLDPPFVQSARWTDIVSSKIVQTYERASALNVLPPRLLDAVVTTLNDGDAIYNTASPPTLIHTDLSLSNVVLYQQDTRWSVAAVIDWEESLVGDAAWEFADLWSSRWGSSPYPLPDAFLYGYKERHALPPDFRVRQRLYRQLHFFEQTVAWAERLGAAAERVQYNRMALERLLDVRT